MIEQLELELGQLFEEMQATQRAIALLHRKLSILEERLDRILSRQEKQHVEIGTEIRLPNQVAPPSVSLHSSHKSYALFLY